MLSLKFQKRIYDAHREHKIVRHGNYEYCIGYNACASIHTWIIRSVAYKDDWHWLQPLDKEMTR